MPRMYHPQLDRHIEVTERQARNRRESGWVDVDEEVEAVHVGGGWYELADGSKVRGNPNES